MKNIINSNLFFFCFAKGILEASLRASITSARYGRRRFGIAPTGHDAVTRIAVPA
ncbi:hypothetical protein [Mesorhizobium amorphae]